ncbi:hypothetical protein K2173_005894 [Erythroxylum novogranatense]|uniref:Protein cereblon n=1 Tax=Erythroxylum novogranatense TaxID=1862640 RepID=A0AAV8U5Q7_9ROSI|nr:hypothetical protein K2173_005894 [Erythroxylum novogranatense]
MEDDGIPAAERQQIEQIRQLEFEELQVEEVDDHDDVDVDDQQSDGTRNTTGDNASDDFNFNTNLASLHTYLGEVEDTHRMLAFLDGGVRLTIPLIYLEGVVLFPEAMLPLRVVQPTFISAVERALIQVNAPNDTLYTIGVVHAYRDLENRRLRFATVGTTAEIRQYRRLEDGSLNVVTRGKQRFRLIRQWIDVEGVRCGEVQIIQEDPPLRTPQDAIGKLAPLPNYCSHGLSNMRPSVGSSHRYGDNSCNSSTSSEESFGGELSLTERTIHESAIDSYYGDYSMEDSQSSDDDKFPYELESTSRMPYPADFDSTKHEGTIDDNELGTGKNSSQKQPNTKEGPKRYRKTPDLDQFRKVPRAFWPHWVYRMHDSYCLAQKAAEMWKQIVGTPSLEDLVKKPDLLSFYIASKIPVSESTRQKLLEIDGVSYRLRQEIDLLDNFDLIRCKICQTVLARRSDMLTMSVEGPLNAYVNKYGSVHEIITLYKANGLALEGRAFTEYSWFPGYAWTIAYCSTCETHMGWLFTATKKLKPKSFWAIRSSQLADNMH